MGKHVWSSFTRKIFIDAPAEQIYWNLATSKGLETWGRPNDQANSEGLGKHGQIDFDQAQGHEAYPQNSFLKLFELPFGCLLENSGATSEPS